MEPKRIVDISLTLQEPMRGFQKSSAKTIDADGWNASTLEIYSHAGTHMDAPLHFDVGLTTIDELDPKRFICNCHIVRLSKVRKRELITTSHLGEVADRVKAGEGLIFHTGWSRYYKEPDIYRDQLPRISEELARWMVEKRINIVGVEPPSIADVNNIQELQTIHRILMEGDVLILEGLCNLERVILDYVELLALPLKIGQGDGAPVRALIVE